jgi:hypothetical protein
MGVKRSFGGEQHQFGYVTLITDHERYNSMCSLPLLPGRTISKWQIVSPMRIPAPCSCESDGQGQPHRT